MKNYTKQIQTLFDTITRDGGEYSDDDLICAESYLESIQAYMDTVIGFNIQKPLLRIQHEGEAYRDKFDEMDKARRRKHQSMTRSINHLNRLCEHYHLPKIFDTKDLDPDSADDRATAAGLCFDFCMEVYILDRCGKYLPTGADGSFDVDSLELFDFDKILTMIKEYQATRNLS